MPTYTENAVRTTLQWALPGGEIAQTRIHWAAFAGSWSIDDAQVDDFAARCQALWDDIDGVYGDDVLYQGVKVQVIDLDGHVSETFDRFITGDPGARTANTLPHEVAVVVSLRSFTDSRAGRGRSYLPPPAVDMVTSTSRFDSAGTAAVSTGMASFLSPLTSGSDTWFSAVQSPTTSSYYKLRSVSVGDVFDAQRRRRDNLAEVRVVTNI